VLCFYERQSHGAVPRSPDRGGARWAQKVRPAARAAYTSSSEGAASLYRTSSAKAGQLYETVSPTVQPYVDYAAV